ncbi:hypothetical protein H1C71_012587 [Ictidomys tridecemlineatus]|nr:hypothetical protein H1C71_012587 [Ictidomys tridecemlineatus]
MEFVPAGTRKLAVGRSLFNIWICQEILLRGNRTALMKAFECARVRAALSVCPELRSRLGPEYSSHHTALMRFTLFKEKFYSLFGASSQVPLLTEHSFDFMEQGVGTTNKSQLRLWLKLSPCPWCQSNNKDMVLRKGKKKTHCFVSKRESQGTPVPKPVILHIRKNRGLL